MYSNLYENEQIHSIFTTTNSNEVPVVSSIRQILEDLESIAKTCLSNLEYEVIPSADALKMPLDGVDVRPRFLDSQSMSAVKF